VGEYCRGKREKSLGLETWGQALSSLTATAGTVPRFPLRAWVREKNKAPIWGLLRILYIVGQ